MGHSNKHVARDQRAIKKSKRKKRKRALLRIGRVGFEYGLTAEDLTEEALEAFYRVGLVQYYRAKRMSDDDRRGIDFYVWGEPPGACHFTINVKSSRTALENALARNSKKLPDNHYFFLVVPEDSVEKVAIDLFEIFAKEMEGGAPTYKRTPD